MFFCINGDGYNSGKQTWDMWKDNDYDDYEDDLGYDSKSEFYNPYIEKAVDNNKISKKSKRTNNSTKQHSNKIPKKSKSTNRKTTKSMEHSFVLYNTKNGNSNSSNKRNMATKRTRNSNTIYATNDVPRIYENKLV